jgi:hypothetical protein
MKTEMQPDAIAAPEGPPKARGQCRHGRALRDHCVQCEVEFRRTRAAERGSLDEQVRFSGMPALGIVPGKIQMAQRRTTP